MIFTAASLTGQSNSTNNINRKDLKQSDMKIEKKAKNNEKINRTFSNICCGESEISCCGSSDTSCCGIGSSECCGSNNNGITCCSTVEYKSITNEQVNHKSDKSEPNKTNSKKSRRN